MWDAKRPTELEAENTRLETIVADLTLDNTCRRRSLGEILTLGRRRRTVAVLMRQFGVSQIRARKLIGQHGSSRR